MPSGLRFVLLQIRDRHDPMRTHERRAFARSLGVTIEQVQPVSLLQTPEADAAGESADAVLIGGAGAYSVADESLWLDRALNGIRRLCETGTPVFASCWGFQAVARALGGTVIHDPATAEVGTFSVFVTEAGRSDPLFAELPSEFPAAMGHEDRVQTLPADAVLLAYSDRTPFQAYRLADRPVYCTQFHPELTREDLLLRLAAYPDYLARAGYSSADEFAAGLRETPAAATLLPRFVDEFVRPKFARRV